MDGILKLSILDGLRIVGRFPWFLINGDRRFYLGMLHMCECMCFVWWIKLARFFGAKGLRSVGNRMD